MITENLFVGYGAKIAVTNNALSSILFPSLIMYENTALFFNVTNTSEMTIKYRSHFTVDNSTVVNTTMATRGTIFQSILDKDTRFNVVQLGKTHFSKSMKIDVSHLIINGDLIDPADELNHKGDSEI